MNIIKAIAIGLLCVATSSYANPKTCVSDLKVLSTVDASKWKFKSTKDGRKLTVDAKEGHMSVSCDYLDGMKYRVWLFTPHGDYVWTWSGKWTEGE